MPEYVVGCREVPIGDGRSLVLPVSTDGHVRERIVRCSGCAFHHGTLCEFLRMGTGPDFFCKAGRPRGDG